MKKYKTTVITTWEIRGQVTSEMINARLQTALNIIMMTQGNGEDYAFFDSKSELEVTTEEC